MEIKMNFDITLSEIVDNGVNVDYGVIKGNDVLTFIKSGRGGTHVGDDGKYIKMARRIHERCGGTVICASNPTDCASSYEYDKRVIKRLADEMGFSELKLYLIGNSNGAYQNVHLASLMPQTQEIMCVNMPLMINFHRACEVLRAMKSVEKIFVYGTEDPSYSYVPFLEIKKLDACRIIRADGIDHCFTDRTDEFVALADLMNF